MVTGYALPDFRPVVVRVTSFSEAAASIRSWVKEAINFLYRGQPRPNFIGYDPRTVELRLGRFVVLGAGSTALVALLSASVLYLLPSAGAGVGGGALDWVEGAPSLMKPPVDNQRHLYVLDGWGGVHPVGASPVLATSASWPTKDTAFSLALFPDGTGGYGMDGCGRLPAGCRRWHPSIRRRPGGDGQHHLAGQGDRTGARAQRRQHPRRSHRLHPRRLRGCPSVWRRARDFRERAMDRRHRTRAGADDSPQRAFCPGLHARLLRRNSPVWRSAIGKRFRGVART